MLAYLGPSGGLVPFKCPSSVEISGERPASYRVTLGGRVKGFRGAKSRRAWSAGIGTATPSEISALQALIEYGTPPWVWVEPYAMVTNLLHPEQSVLLPGTWIGSATVGGAGVTADGTRFGRSLIASGNVDLHCRASGYDRLPVVPGVPVSASVYGSGTGYVRLVWLNSAGGFISNSDGASSTGTLTRRTIGATPPANAVSAQLVSVGLTQITLPAYTFTKTPAVWSIGRGCNRVSVDGLSEAVQMAVADDPSMRRSSISFTVREVG